MKHNSRLLFFFVACLMIILSACNQISNEPSPTELVAATIEPTKAPTNTVAPTQEPTATLIPTEAPTATPAPTETLTPTEEPTAISLPDSMLGTETIPLEELSPEKPWLDLSIGKPMSRYILFNHRKAVFEDPLVRQALSYAIDREVIAALASQYVEIPHRPATVMTPPEILGRDLYGAVGIQYDPQKAKDLLIEAGYKTPSDFPEITFMTPGEWGLDDSLDIANAVAEMWREHLGISTSIEIIDSSQVYSNQFYTDLYDVTLGAWYADYNDPNNFLREPFRTNEKSNYSQYSNSEFDRLVIKAAGLQDPADRQVLYILAEDILCQQDPALIPLFFHGNPFVE